MFANVCKRLRTSGGGSLVRHNPREWVRQRHKNSPHHLIWGSVHTRLESLSLNIFVIETIRACVNETLEIACGPDALISVASAFYGRSDSTTCPSTSSTVNGVCLSGTALNTIKSKYIRCNYCLLVLIHVVMFSGVMARASAPSEAPPQFWETLAPVLLST